MEEFGFFQRAPEGQEELTESRLLDEPRRGYYFQELFRAIYVPVDRSKRKDLLDILNTADGNHRFVCLVQGLECISETQNDQGGNDYAYEQLRRYKGEFMDALPVSFGTYEKNIMTETLESLFPSEKMPAVKIATGNLLATTKELFQKVFPPIPTV